MFLVFLQGLDDDINAPFLINRCCRSSISVSELGPPKFSSIHIGISFDGVFCAEIFPALNIVDMAIKLTIKKNY